jgi:hypothetical protein
MKTILFLLLFLLCWNIIPAQTLDDKDPAEKRDFMYYTDNTVGILPLNGLSLSSVHGITRKLTLYDSNFVISLGIGTNLKIDKYGGHCAFYLEPRFMTRYLSIYFPQGYSPTGYYGRNGGFDAKGFWGQLGLGINIPFINNWFISIDNTWGGTTLGYELKLGLIWRLRGDDFQ